MGKGKPRCKRTSKKKCKIYKHNLIKEWNKISAKYSKNRGRYKNYMPNPIKNWSVYLLLNVKNNENYLGATNDINRRLEEHNSMSWNPKSVTTQRLKGDGIWKVYMQASGLTQTEALSLERKCKKSNLKRKGPTRIERRMSIIMPLIRLKCEPQNILINDAI